MKADNAWTGRRWVVRASRPLCIETGKMPVPPGKMPVPPGKMPVPPGKVPVPPMEGQARCLCHPWRDR